MMKDLCKELGVNPSSLSRNPSIIISAKRISKASKLLDVTTDELIEIFT